MAAQSWKVFFKTIDKYFFGRKTNLPKQDFHWGRVFLVTHFCGYEPDSLIEAQRAIYIAEGDKALEYANLMEEAFQEMRQSAYYPSYLLRKTDDSLARLVASIVKYQPKLGASDAMQEAIKMYIVERIAWEWIDRYASELYREYQATKNEKLIDVIIGNHPHLANGVKIDAEKTVKNYLMERLAWEAKHPDKYFIKPYVSPNTSYHRVTYARAKLSSPAKLHTRTHLDSPPSPRSNAKSLVAINEEKAVAMRSLEMPTFRKVVGLKKFLWIPYLVDALGTLFLHYPAKGICWGINALCGEKKKNSWWAIGLKALFAGGFILGKILTTTAAKVLSPSGLKEIFHGLCGSCQTNRIEPLHFPPHSAREIELSSPSPSPSPRLEVATHIKVRNVLKQETPLTPILKRRSQGHMLVSHTQLSLHAKEKRGTTTKIEVKPQHKPRHLRKSSSVPKDIYLFKIQVEAPLTASSLQERAEIKIA